MKIKNIILTGVAALALTSCNDYLDVDAPSKYTVDFVYSQKSEAERALNGVYSQSLVGDLYGNAYQKTFILNSDVDMAISSSSAHSHTSYQRYDCDDEGGDILKFWTAAYRLIEYANIFVQAAEASPVYYTADDDGNPTTTPDPEMLQWVGEAKCLRAMVYHDLVVMFGDVPFSFEPTNDRGASVMLPVTDREEIQKALIADLQKAAHGMVSTTSTTVERCSKEFAQALIARIALTAGGYSLRPDKSNARSYGTMQRPADYQSFYQTAMLYADSVILAGTHKLGNSFQNVFVNECNYQVINNDDPIYEIPFARESTGNTGYNQGPTYSDYEGATVGVWGKCDGGTRLNAFYRFLFRDGDVRREFVNGLWYYSYYTNSEGNLADSVYIRNDYTVHNNKWSKLWTTPGSALGSTTTGSTGINYPYMRYADVLLMYAEAANELNGGPTDKAVECLRQVHSRAFTNTEDADAAFIAEAQASKDAFQKAVMDERKWEFAGENMRWRDLVRTNTLAQELVFSFLRYYSAGMQNVGGMTGYEDAINEHDGYSTEEGYIDNLPSRVYYHTYNIDEVNAYGMRMYKAQLYGYQVDGSGNVIQNYPNQTMQSLRIYNAYKPMASPITSAITRGGFAAKSWLNADFYKWGNESTGQPVDQCKYSYYGYIRCDDGGNLWIVREGALTNIAEFAGFPNASNLPPVRYILPYPGTVIQRSSGEYKNYYGY